MIQYHELNNIMIQINFNLLDIQSYDKIKKNNNIFLLSNSYLRIVKLTNLINGDEKKYTWEIFTNYLDIQGDKIKK